MKLPKEKIFKVALPLISNISAVLEMNCKVISSIRLFLFPFQEGKPNG
jgi:hypothetical protein